MSSSSDSKTIGISLQNQKPSTLQERSNIIPPRPPPSNQVKSKVFPGSDLNKQVPRDVSNSNVLQDATSIAKLGILSSLLNKKIVLVALLILLLGLGFLILKYKKAKKENPNDVLGKNPNEAEIRKRFADLKKKKIEKEDDEEENED
jgi:hypothetical protein|tara:strand:+ start:143 stop:583 length:441 start_codon:yes stop_codon:yes gene_type:complete